MITLWGKVSEEVNTLWFPQVQGHVACELLRHFKITLRFRQELMNSPWYVIRKKKNHQLESWETFRWESGLFLLSYKRSVTMREGKKMAQDTRAAWSSALLFLRDYSYQTQNIKVTIPWTLGRNIWSHFTWKEKSSLISQLNHREWSETQWWEGTEGKEGKRKGHSIHGMNPCLGTKEFFQMGILSQTFLPAHNERK